MMTSNRLCLATASLREKNQPGIAPYVTAGDGGLEQTLAVLHALEKAGATCVELGIPFSDPIADGPVLQAAASRSLEVGTSLQNSLKMIQQFRADGGQMPLAVMSYINPLLQRGGLEKTCRAIADAGADALIVPDLPIEESAPLEKACAENNLAAVLFAAPTSSEERIRSAGERSSGFLYVVGRVGVTGSATAFDDQTQALLQKARRLSPIPIAVGFGIRTADDIRAATQHADLAIVGTALVEKLHASSNPATTAFDFLTDLKLGLSS
jgi:tryptophan synthase alpha chain